MYDDHTIIEQILAGETGRFRLLVQTYQPLVFQFARNMLRTIEDAEDLTQEVFVAAFQNLGKFDSTRAKFSTWLLTITRNRCLNQLARYRASPPAAVVSVDRGLSPDAAAVANEVWQHLSDALETLPIEQRIAFVLAEIQELSHAEIAMIEQIEVGTVKSRVSRARDKLRQAMQAWQPERAATGSTRKVIGDNDAASENRNTNSE
ncbi:MAG TPA: sigma-70 family RNA polymerase sigma factor [Schlesneria sp.]|jgi:RNA polymerase sigma-70 factor (ECF subfamily)